MNPRISKKEQGLLKGAIRRVFSRSDLRKAVIERGRIDHRDPDRPRVTKWNRCETCGQPTASYQIQVDHKVPLVPLDSALELMTWDEVVDRCWCDENNLQGICVSCHNVKTKQEAAARRVYRKKRKEGNKK